MPFVARDPGGQVCALHKEMANEAAEYLSPDDPEILNFIEQSISELPSKPSMLQSDLDMIRVYEDLTDILLSKNIITLTDFPPAAQAKLMRRKRLRSSLSPITELLYNVDEDGQELP